jgi:hypothetical protein
MLRVAKKRDFLKSMRKLKSIDIFDFLNLIIKKTKIDNLRKTYTDIEVLTNILVDAKGITKRHNTSYQLFIKTKLKLTTNKFDY